MYLILPYIYAIIYLQKWSNLGHYTLLGCIHWNVWILGSQEDVQIKHIWKDVSWKLIKYVFNLRLHSIHTLMSIKNKISSMHKNVLWVGKNHYEKWHFWPNILNFILHCLLSLLVNFIVKSVRNFIQFFPKTICRKGR